VPGMVQVLGAGALLSPDATLPPDNLVSRTYYHSRFDTSGHGRAAVAGRDPDDIYQPGETLSFMCSHSSLEAGALLSARRHPAARRFGKCLRLQP